jgi:hypothetical protein
MAGLASMTYTDQRGLVWSAALASSGVVGQAAGVNVPGQFQLSAGIGNTSPNGANELYSAVIQIAASGTATINVQSFTDVLGQTGAASAMARLKTMKMWLLGTGQTSPDGSVSGTACSGITVGNAGSNPHPMFLTVAATTFTLNNASSISWDDGSANGVPASATVKNILITNLDASNAANVVLTIGGGTS